MPQREWAHDNMRLRVYQPFQPSAAGLTCDGLPVESVVGLSGTPVYIYSADAIRQSFRAIDTAFASYPHFVHYALKANSTLGIVRFLHQLGSRFDANSVGEIQVAQRVGVAPEHLVFTGVGKTRAELEYAISHEVGTINAESPGELDRIAAIASSQGRTARVAVRINPDIDALSHPNISTGLKSNKFGVPVEDVVAIYRDRRTTRGLRFVGLHVHIGSQITTLEPLSRAAATLTDVALALRGEGHTLEHIDLGGGLGIAYEGPAVIAPSAYAAAVVPELRRVGLPVVLEPGRAVVGHAGALITQVVDIKQFPDGRRFAVLDAGMGELIRPAMYGSFHRIVPVSPRPGAETPWDIVGPICESSDVFARGRLLPPLQVDDLLAILDAGAYGSAMASNYNRHLLPEEVLVDNSTASVIRRRQTLDDVLALEV